MYGRGVGAGSLTAGATTGGLAATGVPLLTMLAVAAVMVLSGLTLLRWGRSRYVG